MNNLRVAALIMVCSILGSSFSALADQAMYKKGNMYINLGAGVFSLEDIGRSFSTAASGFGITYSASGTETYSFDSGYQVYGGLGYNFSDHLSYELDLGYSWAEYNDVTYSGTIVATAGGTSLTLSGSQSFNVDGEVSGLSVMNSLVAKFGSAQFNPYLGAGIGLVNFQDEINSISTLVVNGERSGTAPGAGLLAGIDAQIGGGALGLRYRYIWAATGENGFDDATAHAITANYKVPF